MKIVVLDGETMGMSADAWDGLRRLGEVEVYDRSSDLLFSLGNADLRAGPHGFIIRDFIIRFSIPRTVWQTAMPDTSNLVRSV